MGPLKAGEECCSIFPQCPDAPLPPCTEKFEDRRAAGCYAACGDARADCKKTCREAKYRHQGLGGCENCNVDYTSCVASCFSPVKDEYVIKSSHVKAEKEHLMGLAEGVGFEPTVRVNAQRFSRPPRSTAPASLRKN